jgi:hypothetical protein
MYTGQLLKSASSAYTLGVLRASKYLGLNKMASTLIPKATVTSNRLSQGIRATQGADTSLVPRSVLEESPLRQYLSVIGTGGPMESPTSVAFRSQIQSQIDPRDLMSNVQRTVQSSTPELATVPPPRMRAA